MAEDASWEPDFGTIAGDAPDWPAKRPVRVLLMGDFGAAALNGRLDDADAIAARKPMKVEFDTLEDALGRMDLRLSLPIGADAIPVEIAIGDLDAFHPDSLYANVEMFSALSALRKRLNTASTFEAAAREVRAWGEQPRRKASGVARRSRSRGASLPAKAHRDTFAKLLEQPARGGGEAGAIDELLRNVVGPLVQPAQNPDKARLLSIVDEALADAMRAVLHHADFQNVEALWRGADFLLRRIETSHQLQVALLDVSAEELAADLSSVDDLSESGLHRLLVDKAAEDADGGYTYLVGCYRFEATPPQFELLGRMARVAARAGATFVTSVDIDPFTNRKEPPHPLVGSTIEKLRALPEAACLALVGPGFLLRHPYGKRTDPITSFAFEEFQRSAGLRGMLWGNPSLLLACVLCQRGTPQVVGDLPFYTYVDDDGDRVALPCTDRLVNAAAAALLHDYGLLGLMAHKGEPLVRLTGIEALNGSALSAAPLAARPRFDDSRVSLGSGPGAKGAAAGGAKAASGDDDEDATGDETSDSSDTADESADTSSDGGGGDDDLQAMLSNLGDDSDSSADAGESGDAPSSDDGDAEMDPELAALLKNLG